MTQRAHDVHRRGMEFPSHQLLGVRVDQVTMEQAVGAICSMAGDGMNHVVVPVNPEMIMLAQDHPTFRNAINGAELVVPDGVGILFASRFLGKMLGSRVPGVDLADRVSAMASANGLRLFLLGAAPGVAERAAAQLQARYERLQIAGTYAGSPAPDEEEALCDRINDASADILLVAYGAPRQELWVSRNRSRLNVRVIICVGGTLDFLAGVVRRAPSVFQRLGIEWLYRLLRQPSRWRRMLALPRFAWAVLLHGSQPTVVTQDFRHE